MIWLTKLIGGITSTVGNYFTESKRKETAEANADVEGTKQMAGSWKDEFYVILFSLPLIGMFMSPYVDLAMSVWHGTYVSGDLLIASSQALANLEGAPDWYINVTMMMVSVSFGYRKLIDYRLRGKK